MTIHSFPETSGGRGRGCRWSVFELERHLRKPTQPVSWDLPATREDLFHYVIALTSAQNPYRLSLDNADGEGFSLLPPKLSPWER